MPTFLGVRYNADAGSAKLSNSTASSDHSCGSSLQATLKRTIIFVSHDLDEAFKIGNRIALMEGGRIVQIGTAREIIANPVSEYVADFVAHMNPLSVLTARDVMVPGTSAGSLAVEAETPYGGRAVSWEPLGWAWLKLGARRRRERSEPGGLRAVEVVTAETRSDPRLIAGRVLRFGGADAVDTRRVLQKTFPQTASSAPAEPASWWRFWR